MKYALGNMLNGGGLKRLDPDAAAYIAAVEGAGVTVSGGQKSALDTFIRAEKTASRWDLHKRIYLPIWAQATANAICLRSLTSGTFVNSPTHGAGFVQGNGTTQYFDSQVGLPSVGGSNASGSLWVIIPERSNGIVRFEGINGPMLERVSIGGSIANFSQFILPSNNSTSSIIFSETSAGIMIGSTTSTSSRFVKFRKNEGFSTQENTTLDTTVILSGNLFFLARNNNNIGINNAHNEKRGGYGFGLGLTQTQAEEFAANLETVYETLTGIPLP